jgi:hypothetical protein
MVYEPQIVARHQRKCRSLAFPTSLSIFVFRRFLGILHLALANLSYSCREHVGRASSVDFVEALLECRRLSPIPAEYKVLPLRYTSKICIDAYTWQILT